MLSALKTRTRSLQLPYSKRKKICCLWNEGIHFLVPKLANQFISFFSVVYNCWSQSIRSKAISVFVLFTEVAPSIHLEKWMKLDWLPQDPQIFFPRWSWITLNGIWPIWSYTFFLYHAKKKENVFFFPKRLIILHMIISPWYISINFNVINNNFLCCWSIYVIYEL